LRFHCVDFVAFCALVNRPILERALVHRIDALGDSSDTAGFMMAAGIPCYDAWYTHNLQADGYPLYHTVYEGFILYDRILDPEYKVSNVI
jgi:hypothetical protein